MTRKKKSAKTKRNQNSCNDLSFSKEVTLQNNGAPLHQPKNLWIEKNSKTADKIKKKSNSVGNIAKSITPKKEKSNKDVDKKHLNTETHSTIQLNNYGVDLWKNNLVEESKELGENNVISTDELKHEAKNCNNKPPRGSCLTMHTNDEFRVSNALNDNDLPSKIQNKPHKENEKKNSTYNIFISTATQVEKDDFSKLAIKTRKSNNRCKNVVTPDCNRKSKKHLNTNFSPSKELISFKGNCTRLCQNFFDLIQICNTHIFSKAPSQIFRLSVWFGLFVRKSLALVSEAYLAFNKEKLENVDPKQVLLLKSSIDNLKGELQQSQHENSQTIMQIAEHFEKMHKELLDFQEKQLDKIMSLTQLSISSITSLPTPPPPPPPPPPAAPFRSNLSIAPKKLKSNGTDLNNTRPIVISLEDILKVKLKKITTTDRHSNQEDDLEASNNFKGHLKPLRVHGIHSSASNRYTQSLSSASSQSNSRSSSRTRCYNLR